MNDRLREERLRRGWSQKRLSALTGIASPDLSAIECGRRPAFPSWRRRLAQVFGLSEAALFGNEPAYAGTRADWIARCQDAEARVAQLEGALRAVEWCDVDGSVFCPWCKVSGFNGCVEHALDCPRQAALSAPGQPPCKQCGDLTTGSPSASAGRSTAVRSARRSPP